MRKREAEWIARALATLPAAEISPMLELGSNTLRYRLVDQPHIETLLHAPLRNQGVRIVHADIREDEGVDIRGSIFDAEVRERLLAVGARSILCCNILPHIGDWRHFAGICDALLQAGGVLVVTVPHSYPLTLDPTDNYFRPAPDEIAAVFPGYEILAQTSLVDGSYAQDLRSQGRPALSLLKILLRIVTLRGGWMASKARAHKLLWLFRPYRISCVVLRKLPTPPA